MKRILGLGMVMVAAALSMGCAANSQCMRQVNELSATAQQQDQEIRDLQGRVAVVRAEQAGTTLSSLASEGWDATVAGFGWAKAEAPDAYRKASNAYDAAADKMARARKCYEDNGGNAAHSLEEYRAIATKCLGNE
jgi:hypothetical protein